MTTDAAPAGPTTGPGLRRAPVPDGVWTPGVVPAAVLRAMAAEGLLVELVPQVWVAADLAGDAVVRAGALAAAVERAAGPGSPVVARALLDRGVVGLTAAAWVHGSGGPPARVDLLVPLGTGSRPVPAPLRLRRVADPWGRSAQVGPLRVSDPGRAREDAGDDVRDAAALARLRRAAGAGARPARPDGGPRQGVLWPASSRRPVER
ncbi:hypothetical protein WDV85_13490 [Pseudokineococcus sp. 5B2Z-1]|uniref:hypothetical protein n=1 Tax=Pseudokineococcus sp. 5B2Z-1 TaxID=3132744 RepID=UPI003095612C